MRLPDEIRELIDAPNVAHLATILPDGAPTTIPVWVMLEGEYLLVGTGALTSKARNTRRDPRVALSIVDRNDPYRVAHLRGRVIEQREDEDFRVMDALARKYTGEPFPFRHPGRVALVIAIDRAEHRQLPFHPPGA